MNIVLINTPNRDIPTEFPPFAPLSLISYLRSKGGYDASFINVDYFRYSIDELANKIVNMGCDIVGISAVTSTSYKFVKQFSLKLKNMGCDVELVLGGNLAASSEIILQNTGVDYCVIGEGEKIFLNLVDLLNSKIYGNIDPNDFDNFLKKTRGLVYLSDDRSIVNTGYEDQLSADEIYSYDLSDLGESISHYIFDLFDSNGVIKIPYFTRDKRVYEKNRREKKFFKLIAGKGCVAKCTFCHRWDKGIRHIPIEILMEKLDFLIDKYDVGFIEPAIEAFATDKKWLIDFCKEIKKRDVLWYTHAVRAKSISPELISVMRDSGCTSILYGLETGSDLMLNIMEKKTTLEHNINAQKWTIDAGFYSTVIQLVIGMPGESNETIRDTIKFLKYSYLLSSDINPMRLSTNFAQALPGTPLYEFARTVELIKDEEKYLLSVSNKDASDGGSIINFTEYPMAILWAWKFEILSSVIYAYSKKYGFKHTLVACEDNYKQFSSLGCVSDAHGYGIPFCGSEYSFSTFVKVVKYIIFYKIKRIMPVLILINYVRKNGYSAANEHIEDYFNYIILGKKTKKYTIDLTKSLRKSLNDIGGIVTTNSSTDPLRRGR